MWLLRTVSAAEFSREADDPSTQVRIGEALAKHAERTEVDSRGNNLQNAALFYLQQSLEIAAVHNIYGLRSREPTSRAT